MRRGDEEGTNAIFSFFGDTVKPVYSLKEAIADGVLVPYDYFISMAPLSETELDEWDELSTRISRELAMNDGRLTDKARKLSIRRARISKRAESKAEIAAKLVHQNMEHGDRWLVYCESVSHLSEVRAAMERALGKSVTLMEFHSKNMQEHERVINFFETKGGVVLAIKCLDEGVDIPIINKAIILSSSSNPREFVQRRGRVLRRHPAKRLAQIWDLVSVRSDGRPIAGSELLRASEFADSSNNQAVKFQLSLMSDTFGTILNVDR
jgi:superfamily II DNA or RNA helicase